MMGKLKLYKSEINDNIVLDKNKTVITASVKLADDYNKDIKQSISTIKTVEELIGYNQPDLALVVSILVSTGWNLNDDVFTPSEVWAAKHTPVHKPMNDNHNSDKILGHIINSRALDKDGNEITLSDGDNIPDNFDLEVAGVLYKILPDVKDRIKEIIDQANSGDMFVSMEAWFTDFDYAFVSTKDNTMRILGRNENTAFLTKYLRTHGGPGEFQGFKIGRVLKNITFGGQGFVSTPANPESIIKVAACKNIDLKDLEGGVGVMETNDKDDVKNVEANDQKTELDTLKEELITVKKDLETANKDLVEAKETIESNSNKHIPLIDKLTKEKDALVAEIKKLQEDLVKTKQEIKDVNKKHKGKARLDTMKQITDIEDEDTALAEFTEMSDEAFDILIKYANKTEAKDDTVKEEEGDQKVNADSDVKKEAQVDSEQEVETEEEKQLADAKSDEADLNVSVANENVEEELARSVAFQLIGQEIE